MSNVQGRIELILLCIIYIYVTGVDVPQEVDLYSLVHGRTEFILLCSIFLYVTGVDVPQEVDLYSLVQGRTALILFGGLKRDIRRVIHLALRVQISLKFKKSKLVDACF